MPVLTCPFATIPALNLNKANLYFPGESRASELTIKPTAGETWAVEGLSLSFTITTQFTFSVNTETAYNALKSQETAIVKQEEALAKKKTAAEGQLTHAKEELEAAKGVVTEAENIYKEDGFTKTLYKEYLEAVKGQRAAEASISAITAEIEGLVEDQQGYVRDLFQIQKELAELGKTAVREGIRLPILATQARLYVRGNELVWNATLGALVSLKVEAVHALGKYTYAEATVTESFSLHEQYDDPIGITERENLRLVFQFTGPAAIIENEGQEILGNGMNTTPIQAIVNYSRHTEGGQ